METKHPRDGLMNLMNVFILLVIVLVYTVTGTGLGEDAVAALSDRTVYRAGKQGAMALECIVSWDASAMEEILACLDENDARITFFVSGEWAKTNADTLQRMAEDGHEIGSCGYLPSADGDADFVAADIAAANGVIRSITGQAVSLYHGGLRDADVSRQAASALNLTHVACTADLLSARGEGADVALRASKQVFDGSILMIQPTRAAAEALPAILDAFREAGLAIKPVGELLE